MIINKFYYWTQIIIIIQNTQIVQYNIIKNYMKTNLIITEKSFTAAFLKKLNTFKTLDIKKL